MSAKEYPEHLNPFDDNYTGVQGSSATLSKQKYNTWSASRSHRVAINTTTSVSKAKPTILDKPWAALNISPNGKLVRRLSILKTAVERFATRKKRLSHSKSYTEGDLPPRSHSVHDEFSFRIISPKLKDKIRQQAFSKSLNKQDQQEADPPETPISPQLNGRLSPPKPEEPFPASPESEKEFHLGARPKTRKKRPPPPPPIDAIKTENLVLQSDDSDKAEDSFSVNSSITQDLERDATSEEENSKAELYDRTSTKETDRKM